MRNYLVAGGAGYIGSNFVKYVLDNTDHNVVIVDNLSTGFRSTVDFLLGKYGKRLKFLKGDIGDSGLLHPFLRKNEIHGAFHFAAYSLVGESQIDPLKYYHNNVSNTVRFIKVLVEHDIASLVFSSSAAVYGIPSVTPIEENQPRNPINHYGATKAMIEDILQAVSETEVFRYAALRYFNVAGTDSESDVGEMHDPETHLIPIAVQAALGKRKRFAMFGTDYDTPDGTCVRDYIHVTDLCKAHLAAMGYIETHDESPVMNLGSEKGYSVREVVKTVKDICRHDIDITEEGRRPGDPPTLVASYGKASRLLGWKPERGLREMVSDVVKWERRGNLNRV